MIRNLPKSVHPLQTVLQHVRRNIKPTLDKATRSQTKTGEGDGEENRKNNLCLATQGLTIQEQCRGMHRVFRLHL